eukprot:5327239-Prorocentrum_lima.AAC.1
MVEKIIDAFKQTWKCRVTGIIPRDGCATEEEVSTLVFLGMVVELAENSLVEEEGLGGTQLRNREPARS